MPINFKGQDVQNVKYKDKQGILHQLDKVVFGGIVVWENWVKKTGEFGFSGDRQFDSLNHINLYVSPIPIRNFVGNFTILLSKDQGWNPITFYLEGKRADNKEWEEIGAMGTYTSNPDWGVGPINKPFKVINDSNVGYTELRLKCSNQPWRGKATIRLCYVTEWEQKGSTGEPTVLTPHSIKVTNGTSYPTQAKAGEIVTITANEPPLRQTFDRWTTENQEIYFANEFSSQTTFTMIDNGVTVTANYKSTTRPTYQLVVDNGTGSGWYEEGTSVTVTANTLQGMKFKTWKTIEGNLPASFSEISATNTFAMPNYKFHVQATYKNDVTPIPPSGQWQEGVGELSLITNAPVEALSVNRTIMGKAPGHLFKVDTFKFMITTNESGVYIGPRIIIYGIDEKNETVKLFDSMFDSSGLYNKDEFVYTVKQSNKDIPLTNIKIVMYGGDYYNNITATVNYLKLTKYQEKR